jgi:hypothetical protein
MFNGFSLGGQSTKITHKIADLSTKSDRSISIDIEHFIS